MGTYVLIDLLWAGGSVAPAQPTSLRWNWGIFAPTCSTCLEGPYRKDSSGAHPCRVIDKAWEPRIPSPCSLKAITRATGSKIGSSRSRWNRGTEYYPVGMKTHIPYHIEMGTYVLIDLLWAGGTVAPPNRLASDEADEILPNHVPHVQKDHIGKIHLVLNPVGR